MTAATALILNGPGKYSLDRALGARLPGWLAPLGLVVIVVLTVLYGPSVEEPPAEAPAEEEAREGLAGGE
jgi:putative oxidoreductase